MPTPLKDPKVRQRTNRATSAATLASPLAAKRELPPRGDGVEWHPEALEVWRLAWESSMSTSYVEADVPGLKVLADLTHLYWMRPSSKTAAELRMQRAAYGLDPLARMRLQWKIEPPAAAKPAAALPTAPRDPRLRAVG